MLFLPDRYGFLKRVNQPMAGLKGSSSVRGCHHNQYAGLTNFQLAKAMNYDSLANCKFSAGFIHQRLHLLERHWLVSFVVKEWCLAAAAVIAHHTFEDAARAIGRLADR